MWNAIGCICVQVHPGMTLSWETLKALPKAELHRHLDGSLSVETIYEMARQQQILHTLPTQDLEELRSLVQVSMECQSLVEYLKSFEITLKVLQVPYAITQAVYEVCRDAFEDGVVYLEIRFSPILHTQKGLSLSQVMKAVCEGLVLAQRDFCMLARIIVSGLRHLNPNVTASLAEICWRYRSQGVAGFDLAGPEDGFSSETHKKAFGIVRDHMINCTIHSGEASGWESIADAIRYCGATRLGHGIMLKDNLKLQNYVRDRGITVEVCITSNMQTKGIKTWKDHPIRKFFDAGVPVVPCCDNTTVSNVTSTGEFSILQEQFDFTPSEIVRLIDYGFQGAFLPIGARKRMRMDALRKCCQILMHDGVDGSELDKLLLEPQFYDLLGADLLNHDVVLDVPVVQVDVKRGRGGGNLKDEGLVKMQKEKEFLKTEKEIPREIPKSPGIQAMLTRRPSLYFRAKRSTVIPLQVIEQLPKCDLHVHFDGAVSYEWLVQRLCEQDGENAIHRAYAALTLEDSNSNYSDSNSSKEDCNSNVNFETSNSNPVRSLLAKLLSGGLDQKETRTRAKLLVNELLQEEKHLVSAVRDIRMQAARDNVVYLELMVRPESHTHCGLSPQQVVDILVKACADESPSVPLTTEPMKGPSVPLTTEPKQGAKSKSKSKSKNHQENNHALPKVSLVLYASSNRDDPVAFYELAQLAVKNRDLGTNVVGFGVYGERDFTRATYKDYARTFHYLKEHSMHVVMSAGQSDSESIRQAIHRGGAVRIGAGFAMHQSPRVMEFCASHGIALELSISEKLDDLSKEMSAFAKNPIRFYIDHDVPVAIVSLRSLFHSGTRSERLAEVCTAGGLSPASLLRLLANAFHNNLLSLPERSALLQVFLKRSLTVMAANGMGDVRDLFYFPPTE